VDGQFEPLAPKIQAALAEVTSKPVRFVLNTHWHGDHTHGNAAFGQTATIIAHASLVASPNDSARRGLRGSRPLASKARPPSLGASPIIPLAGRDPRR